MIPALETPRSQGDDTGRSIVRTSDRWEYLMINKEPCAVGLLTHRTTTDLTSSAGEDEDIIGEEYDQDITQYMQVVSEHTDSTTEDPSVIYEAQAIATDEEECVDDIIEEFDDDDEEDTMAVEPGQFTQRNSNSKSSNASSNTPDIKVYAIMDIIAYNGAVTIRDAISQAPLAALQNEIPIGYITDIKVVSVLRSPEADSSKRATTPLDKRAATLDKRAIALSKPSSEPLPVRKSPVRRRTIGVTQPSKKPSIGIDLKVRQTSSDDGDLPVTLISMPEGFQSPVTFNSPRIAHKASRCKEIYRSPPISTTVYNPAVIGSTSLGTSPRSTAWISSPGSDFGSPRSPTSQPVLGLASARWPHDRVKVIGGRAFSSSHMFHRRQCNREEGVRPLTSRVPSGELTPEMRSIREGFKRSLVDHGSQTRRPGVGITVVGR